MQDLIQMTWCTSKDPLEKQDLIQKASEMPDKLHNQELGSATVWSGQLWHHKQDIVPLSTPHILIIHNMWQEWQDNYVQDLNTSTDRVLWNPFEFH
jgi:hypothetical protein